MTEASRETPCVGICEMDARTALCVGCGRTLAEIASWGGMASAERRAIMRTLDRRMRAAGLAPAELPRAR